MKSLLVVGCLLLVGAVVRADIETETKAYAALAKPQIEECAKKLNIPLEGLEDKYLNFNLDDAEKKNMGCLQACLMTADGSMEGDVLKPDQMRTTMMAVISDPTVLETRMKSLEKCADTVKGKTDKCELAYGFTECVIRESKSE